MTDQSNDPGPSAGKAFEQRMEAFGHEVEEAAQRVSQSPEVKAGVDVWGSVGDAFPLMRGLKEQFDPGRILNPGRFVGGL